MSSGFGLQGKFPDTNLLDISDVELHDLQMFEDNPVIVVKFSCQQIRQDHFPSKPVHK